jgi:hypothetical protein
MKLKIDRNAECFNNDHWLYNEINRIDNSELDVITREFIFTGFNTFRR